MEPLIILVVDPYDCGRTALMRLLETDGHEVTATGSWATAQRLTCEGPFDLLISERSLRGQVEQELLKTLQGWYGTIGIVLTAHEEQQAGDWRRAGFANYLRKPVSFQQVRSVIASATAGQPLAVPARQKDETQRIRRSAQRGRWRAHGVSVRDECAPEIGHAAGIACPISFESF